MNSPEPMDSPEPINSPEPVDSPERINSPERKDSPEQDLSVQNLVDYTCHEGDINFRFSTKSNAIDGIKGHQRVQKSRAKHYVAEHSVKARFEWPDVILNIKGRLDGYQIDGDLLTVDEIKTIRVDVSHIPQYIQNQHWAQLKIYACLLAEDLAGEPPNKQASQINLKAIKLRLCYLDLEDNQEHQLILDTNITELKAFVQARLDRYITDLRNQAVWTHSRNNSIAELKFPYGEFRSGQREMAVSIYRTFQQTGQLVIQAPTGIGKTMGSLFPGITALGKLGYEKLFYLSAKTSGQAMARAAVADLKVKTANTNGLRLRDITITAKSKVCFNPGMACEPSQCEYAGDYYKKLPAVKAEVLQKNISLNRETIDNIALKHQMCPFELSLDLALGADIIICDYNYVFDPTVYLRRFFNDEKHNYALLIDETHNLPDRARDMYSAALSKKAVLNLRKLLKDDQPLIAKRLHKINAEFLNQIKVNKIAVEQGDGFASEAQPEKLIHSLRHFTESAEEWLQLNQPSYFHQELLDLYFDVLRILRMAELADEQYRFLFFEKYGGIWFKVFCLNPGPKLEESFKQIKTSICFSATLGPRSYFERLLGITPEAPWYEVASPFNSNKLGVFVTSYLDTSYRNRANSLYELVDTIADLVQGKTGNYMIYLPSYAYLNDVLDKFTERHGTIRTITQTSNMAQEERDAFILEFKDNPKDTLLGFALMGGIFGEGIDLKGTRLIGALIVGVGLPQIGLERNLIKQYFDTERRGFEFAYQYPGMNKVLQTAGRVIRTESDQGIVCLLDRRFLQPTYSALLPESWEVELADDRSDIKAKVRRFWDD